MTPEDALQLVLSRLDECGYESKGNTWVSPSWIAIERQSTAIGALDYPDASVPHMELTL